VHRAHRFDQLAERPADLDRLELAALVAQKVGEQQQAVVITGVRRDDPGRVAAGERELLDRQRVRRPRRRSFDR
jgi:hypothetical protein